MSLLSSASSVLISPANAYINTLILPSSEYRATACERSFGSEGRLKPVAQSKWSGGYAFRPFKITTTNIGFPYSRRNSAKVGKGCNIAAVWTPHTHETLINGVLQGRKQTDFRGASLLSQARSWDLFLEVYSKLKLNTEEQAMIMHGYMVFKRSDALKHRRDVKSKVKAEALKGWGAGLNYAGECIE